MGQRKDQILNFEGSGKWDGVSRNYSLTVVDYKKSTTSTNKLLLHRGARATSAERKNTPTAWNAVTRREFPPTLETRPPGG